MRSWSSTWTGSGQQGSSCNEMQNIPFITFPQISEACERLLQAAQVITLIQPHPVL